jgi:hypothetical protein
LNNPRNGSSAGAPTGANAAGEWDTEGQHGGRGLIGYIRSHPVKPPPGYGAGIGFYSAVYPILPESIDGFQIGLVSTWIIPDNSDNTDTPLCPCGTHARDNWPKRGPTYEAVFQTIEGGLGIWGSTQFRAGYKPPKFQIVGVPDCYCGNYLISPGWSNKTVASPDDMMGIAQLSNRMLLPPDGLTFRKIPRGELFGYSWMALPLADGKAGPPPTGDQHWTLFLALANFKGPVAFFIPEIWSKISTDYKFDYGRGLDAREGLAGGAAQELGNVPYFEVTDDQGVAYSKVPSFIYPVDDQGKTVLMQDMRRYSKRALADAVSAWRKGGAECSGLFDTSADACNLAEISVSPIGFHQTKDRLPLRGIDEVVQTAVFDSHTFGLQWNDSPICPNGEFPRYFKAVGGSRTAVPASEVPEQLREKRFRPGVNKKTYSSPTTGAWGDPGPVSGAFHADLADGSRVTYHWYRFLDQPSLQQHRDARRFGAPDVESGALPRPAWSDAVKSEMQSIVEGIHRNWTIDKEYMPPPSSGRPLVEIDPALIVTPPAGLEAGYVPIATRQEEAPSTAT